MVERLLHFSHLQNYQPGVIYSNEEKVDVLWTDGVIYPSVVKSREDFIRFDVRAASFSCLPFISLTYSHDIVYKCAIQLCYYNIFSI